jgi:hypothetical protein
MAQQGNDWNSFMQSREVRVAMYGICAAFCIYHCVSAVFDLLHPENSMQLIEAMGSTAFYAMTVVRFVALAWAGVAFGRMALKAFREKSE